MYDSHLLYSNVMFYRDVLVFLANVEGVHIFIIKY